MSNLTLFRVEDEKLVPYYKGKMKGIKSKWNAFAYTNAIVSVSDFEIKYIVIENAISDKDDKFTLTGSGSKGTLYVKSLGDKEIKDLEDGYVPEDWIKELKNRKMLVDKELVKLVKEEGKMPEVKNVAVVENEVNGGKVEEVEEVVEEKGEVEMLESKGRWWRRIRQ